MAAKRHSVRPPAVSLLGAGMIIAGKYRLDKLLASGGMGDVWVATNLVLESKVAIKVLTRTLVQSQEATTRLLQEARATARISHRNIIQVFDFGYIETGEPFIVMELLRGESLGDRLERVVRIPAVTAVEIIVPVAHALATAHAKGIVHRDLKPWNVFLAIDESNLEVPKVVDFGIAKEVSRQHVRKVTQEGRVLGSPEYLSPEQARGDTDIDARVDVWGLSVTLYEAITGHLPFEDENYNRLLWKIIEDEPVSSLAYAAGDERLWMILSRGLAKKRELRWQSAQAMGAALEQWIESHGVFTTGGLFRNTEPSIDMTPGVPAGSIRTPERGLRTPSSLEVTADRPAARRRWISRALWVALALVATVAATVAATRLIGKSKLDASAASPASAGATSGAGAQSEAGSMRAEASAVASLAPPASIAAPTSSTLPPAGPAKISPAPPTGASPPPKKAKPVPAIPVEPNF